LKKKKKKNFWFYSYIDEYNFIVIDIAGFDPKKKKIYEKTILW
jgi:hypothetical protein